MQIIAYSLLRLKIRTENNVAPGLLICGHGMLVLKDNGSRQRLIEHQWLQAVSPILT